MAIRGPRARLYVVDPSIASLVGTPSRHEHSSPSRRESKMSLPWRFASVDDYVDGTIIQLQSGCPKLKSLKIGKYYLHGSDLESHHVVLLLQHAKDNVNLTEVSMHGVVLDARAAASLRQLISSTTPRQWEMVEFNFCHGDGVKILSAPTLIKCIKINNCWIGREEISAVGLNLKLNRLLTKLELHEEDLRGSFPGQALADGLAITGSLESLEFGYCRFDDDGIESLANGLAQNKSLVNFMCPGCELEDTQIARLSQSLSNHPRLRHVKLFRNHCGLEGATALAGMLGNDAESGIPLLSLDLSYQQFERAKKLDLGLLSSSLSSNASLTELILSFNKLDDTDAEMLAYGLKENHTLQTLDLRANNIRDAGTIAIADQLVAQSSLKKLFLFGNPFRKDGASALLTAIRNNAEMEVLNMDYNVCFYDSIQFYCYLNQAGRHLLKNDTFNPALWPLVLARAKQVSEHSHQVCTQQDIIFYLIQGPTLTQ